MTFNVKLRYLNCNRKLDTILFYNLTASQTVPWPANSWIKLNAQQMGVYRVMYPTDNWNRLATALQTDLNVSISRWFTFLFLKPFQNFIKVDKPLRSLISNYRYYRQFIWSSVYTIIVIRVTGYFRSWRLYFFLPWQVLQNTDRANLLDDAFTFAL